MHVKDQIVVITGASSGIGKATAIKLAKLGAKVMLGARRATELQSIVAQIEKKRWSCSVSGYRCY